MVNGYVFFEYSCSWGDVVGLAEIDGKNIRILEIEDVITIHDIWPELIDSS